MELRKKIKNFFTLTRKANAGFTLVELIVVIAILAILGGVAVPAYSGYVKKAERSADEALLNELNTAFASACMANGESNYGRTDVADIVPTDGAVADGALNTSNDNIDASFDSFFEGGTFKVFTKLFYSKATGGFSVDEILTYKLGDKDISMSAKDVAILSGDNAFSERGSEVLLEDIGVLENLLETGIGQDVLDSVKISEGFISALGSYMGLSQNEGESSEDYASRVEVALGSQYDDPSDVLYSAQIMYAASNAANATDEQIADLFTGTVTSNIEVKNADGTTNNEATMANAALAYGMYTAYLQHNPQDGEPNFTNIINSTEFASYYNSPEGQADLEAYKAAMNMVSDNTGNSAITGSILKNGIVNNVELEALMKEVMGN